MICGSFGDQIGIKFDQTQIVFSHATATPKMLTQQLRELEQDGLITRTVYPVVPPKTEYALTEFGSSLIPVLDALSDWGRNYLEQTHCTTASLAN